MKIEIVIPDEEIKEKVIDEISKRICENIWNGGDLDSTDWDKRMALTKKRQQEILAKIDWKNAGSQLSETVVQKFFMNLLERR